MNANAQKTRFIIRLNASVLFWQINAVFSADNAAFLTFVQNGLYSTLLSLFQFFRIDVNKWS